MEDTKKNILLKEICSRLPYSEHNGKLFVIEGLKNLNQVLAFEADVTWSYVRAINIDEIKLVLRPMDSMSEEEKSEFYRLLFNLEKVCFRDLIKGDDSISPIIDWLLKNNFDFRGLFQMGIAMKYLKKT